MMFKSNGISTLIALAGLLLGTAAYAEQVHIDFKRGAEDPFHFYVFVPKNAQPLHYFAQGTGKAVIGIKRCGKAQGLVSTDSPFSGIYDLRRLALNLRQGYDEAPRNTSMVWASRETSGIQVFRETL